MRYLWLSFVPVLAIIIVSGVVLSQSANNGNIYTGCLQVKGVGGNLKNIAIGLEPTQPCQNNEVQASWNETGPQGPPGPPGLPGTGASYYKKVASSGGPTGTEIVALCDSGDVAIGGSGYRIPEDSPDIREDDAADFPYPDDLGSAAPPTGWMTYVQTTFGTTYVTAICMDLTP